MVLLVLPVAGRGGCSVDWALHGGIASTVCCLCSGDNVVHCTGKTPAGIVPQRCPPWSPVLASPGVTSDCRGTAEKRQRSSRELTVVFAIADTVLKLPFLSYYGLVRHTGIVVLIVAALQ